VMTWRALSIRMPLNSARHVIECHLTHETRNQDSCDDVASTVHQSLPNGIEVDGIGPMANRSMHIADAGGQNIATVLMHTAPGY